MGEHKTWLTKAVEQLIWFFRFESLGEDPESAFKRRGSVSWILKSESLPFEPEEKAPPLGARFLGLLAPEELPYEEEEGNEQGGSLLNYLLSSEELPEEPVDRPSILSLVGWLLKPERLEADAENKKNPSRDD